MISRKFSKWQMFLGLFTVLVTFWGTIHFVDPFYPHTYPFAWYGMILFLDGLLWWRWDESLIVKRPREFGTLLLWSAIFWFFFEIWNIRLQNWYYVGVSPNALWAHVESYLDFATVLPGMFLVYRLLFRLNVPRPVRTRFHLSKNCRRIFPGVGFIMIVLAYFFPDYCYPLIWGAFFFLLEPLCAAKRGPSLLRDGEMGDWTVLVRLLISGLFCGGYWELCNYWSQAKWIYTVPFFSQGKLFEMPYLGFVGFPPFCVACFVLTNTVYLLRNGKHWLPEIQNRSYSHGFQKGLYLLAVATGLLLSEWSYSMLNRHTIDSRSETVSQIVDDISTQGGKALRESGWRYPLNALKDWDEASDLIPPLYKESIRNRLELAAHLLMGSSNARLLEEAGVFTVKDLANRDAQQLYLQLLDIDKRNSLRKAPVVKRRVVAWVQGAKRRNLFY